MMINHTDQDEYECQRYQSVYESDLLQQYDNKRHIQQSELKISLYRVKRLNIFA